MNDLAKTALLGIYKYSGACAAQERMAHLLGNQLLPILLLHRVTDDIPPDGVTVTKAWFRGLCEMLHKRFHVVTLSEAMHQLNSGQRWPRRMTAITFDDCYRDNFFAARELARYGLPACFFIPTAFPGTDHVFAWDTGLKRMPNLTWDDIREMTRMGHEIGSHTVHHADLSQISAEEARRELADSKQTLETELGQPVRWFAYPYGAPNNFLPERLPLVYEVGYEGCFSGYGGFVRPSMKDQVIPRVPVPYFRSLLTLELYLTGCLDWALKRRARKT
jgi:peptidoglycan/xylan/chitin deacetylase (PgdA/CDA1 family)